jgi:tRNA threonylcarbamoyl adenosine modification protein YeaZ
MSSAYALALHTTSPQLGLAISNLTDNFSIDRRSQIYNLGRDLSTHLHSHLREFIQPQTWVDLAFIAAAKGPGSFTSTRLGMVTARTLAQQLNIPLYGISSLAAVAWKLKDNYSIKQNLAIQMPATRGELFVGIYQYSGIDCFKTILADTTITPAKWQEKLAQLETNYQLIRTSELLGDTVDSVLDLARLEYQQGKYYQWSEAIPFYGQHSI